ncbi:tetratricopeptide repeat protein, partial [Acinetobacter baumannii]
MVQLDRAEKAFASGNFELALAEGEQALQLNPKSPRAILLVARALIRTGRPHEAIERLKTFLKRQPDQAEAL